MADIVCPKCGKPNPAGSTTCRYCNSRLTAAVNKPETPAAPTGNSDDAPDWLNSLRGDTNAGVPWSEQSAEENPQTSSPLEGDVPDWLQRIRERNQEGDEANQQLGLDNSSQASAGEEQMPDWLNQTSPNANSSSTTALEDWLKKLHQDEPASESKPAAPIQSPVKPASIQPKKPAAQPDDETSEWLKGLQTWKPSTPLFDADLSSNQESQIPSDSNISDQKAPSVQSAAQENNEKSDWLKGFSTPEAETPPSQQPTVSPNENTTIGGHTGVTDWLRDLPAQSHVNPPPETPPPHQQPVSPDETPSAGGHTGVTDWLRDLPAQSHVNPPPEPQAPQQASVSPSEISPVGGHTGVTDWLRDLPGQSHVTPPAETPAPDQPQDQAAPDLLSRIPEQPSVPPNEITSIGGRTGVTDWLRHLSNTQSKAKTPPATGLNQDSGTFDWLSDLRGTPDSVTSAGSEPAQDVTPAQPNQEPAAIPAEETPDWLQSQSPSPAEPTAPAQPVQGTPTAPAEEIPDWLKSFSPNQADAEVQSVRETPAAPAEETPDWLKNLSASPTETTASAPSVQGRPAAPAEEIPDWLKDFTPNPEGASAQPGPKAEETPDWLKSFAPSQEEAAAPAQPAAPAEETPDWLKSFAPSQDEAAASAQPATPAEETSDWLKSLAPSQDEAAAPSQPVEQVTAAPVEETPDWLKSFAPDLAAAPAQENEVFDRLQAVSPQPADAIQAQPVVASDSTLPASQMPAASQAAEQAKPALPQPASSGEVPDWLQNISGRPATDEASAAQSAEQPAGENAPDWLQSFGSAGLAVSASDSAGNMGQPAASETPAEAEPDWLSKITRVIPPTDQAGAPPAAPAIETGGAVLGEIPDWLSNIKPQEISPHEETSRSAFVLDNSSIELPASEEPGKNPFAGEGVPDWLSEVPQGGETQSDQTSQADGSTEHLEPAQLPGWLQAMRPLEAVTPAAVQLDDQRVEKSGPLAGLKGVLPGDDVVTQYRKPPSYSVKLKISEKQHTSANLLEQMLGQESSPQAIPQDRVRIPQRLVRLAIAILLLAVLLFPLLTSGGSLVPPVVTPPTNVVQFHDALDALPDGGHVLLAVDYDPGFAGEMRFAASGVVERLIEKNESLVLVSTVPAGPVMAQNLISQTLQSRPDLAAKYSLSTSVINLGYLPGGATSLQEFASAPRQAAQYGFKAGVDANSPWLQPALQNIQDVSQFSMVMVLTDSLDSGRAWIEQVQPAMNNTPLMMVVSAQVAPLIQPYVFSGQVKAMISGIAGGTAYQQYLKTALNSSADWNAYTYGLLLLIAFILLGIVLQIGTFLFSHRKGGG